MNFDVIKMHGTTTKSNLHSVQHRELKFSKQLLVTLKQ